MANISQVLTAKRDEFFDNVWDHTADAFQIQFDDRRELADGELKSLEVVLGAIAKDAPDVELGRAIRTESLRLGDEFIALLLQLVGSTRNKIITDLKAQVGKDGSRIPASYDGLVHSDSAWALAGPYLARRVRTVFAPILQGGARGAFEALNQATYPGYIRQERAKRQGHEAEARLAIVLASCGIPFEPKEKSENPLCRDAQVASVSFDIVVPSVNKPKMCVKATVHTSNIGQYGESKDALEAAEAKLVMKKSFPGSPPLVVVLIDGVGFRSNSAGLNGVLESADEFCQFKTLWKGAVVAAWAAGMRLELELGEEASRRHADFLQRYARSVTLLKPGTLKAGAFVAAGEARIRRP